MPFIHSFWPFILCLFKSATAQKRSRHSTDTVSEFHAEAPQATASSGLAQGPNVAARAGFEPTILWSKGFDSTNAPHLPQTVFKLHAPFHLCRPSPISKISSG